MVGQQTVSDNNYNSVESLEAGVGYCKTKIKIRKSSQINYSSQLDRQEQEYFT